MMQTPGPSELSFEAESVFLGLGGQRPGVMMLRPDSEDTQRLIGLPIGQSVYALDVHAGTGRIAYGTRTGTVQAAPCSIDRQNGQPPSRWAQGAPLLAVCWVGDSLLCSADTRGGCLLWNASDPNDPERLETEGKVICSLASWPNGQLAGLSGDGYLLFWSVSSRRLLRCVQGAVPPRKLALVTLVAWPRPGSLIYPTEDGRLCTLSHEASCCQYVDAHQGSFYVIVPVRDGLLSVGQEDRMVRLWDRLPGKPVWEAMLPWPRPVVSGWPMGYQAGSLLLIDREGTATVFDYADGAVGFVRQLPGTNYRTAVGMSWVELKRRYDARRATRINQLQTQAKEAIEHGRTENLETMANEMASLGFKRVSLGLRTQQARLENRWLDELHVRIELMELLGNGDKAPESIRQHVLLLKRLWQLAEAWSICCQYPGLDDGDAWLRQAVEALAQDHSVVEPDVPLKLVVGAASVLAKPLSGTWVIMSSAPMNLPPTCPLEAFLEKYQNVRESSAGSHAVPAATCQTVPWIARDRIEQVILIDLDSSLNATGGHLHTALRFEQGNGLGSLKPVLLLAAGGRNPDTTALAHNDALLSVLDIAGTPQAASAQQLEAQRLVTETVRRLWTESLWRRNQGKVHNHGL